MSNIHEPGWRIENMGACYWIVLNKYVLRIGKPFNKHHYRYAWRPLISFFRCFK